MFVEVKDRVAKKLAGWKGKLLSIGGREILIKAVAQAVPTYTMGLLPTPQDSLPRLGKYDEELLVGAKGQREQDCVG